MAKRSKSPKTEDAEQLERQQTLESAVSRVVEAMGSSAGSVTLWDAERHQTSHSSTYGLSHEDFERIKPMIDEALPAFEGKGSAGRVLVPRGRKPAPLRITGKGGPVRMFALPLRSQGKLVGLLCLFNSPEQPQAIKAASGLQEVVIDRVDVVYQNAQLLQRLVEEKRWLEGVIRSSADGILIVDRECRIVGFNPVWERLTGWRIDEARGRPCGDVFSTRTPNGASRCDAACPMRLAAQGHPLEPGAEVLLRRRDGSEIPAEMSYAVIYDDEGASLGGVVSARDISARKEAEALQSTFLSVVSHELQTPIAIIKGYAGLLGDQGAKIEPSQLKEKLAVIQEESERLSKMVENLLSASRIQAGGVELKKEPMQLDRLIRRTAEKMRSVGTKHAITTRLPRRLPLVVADYDRTQQVLMNLLDNAMKYSPAGGTIRVTASAGEREVVVRVTDHGSGVSEADRERIFRPFSRLDSRLVREVKGAGLGLYICKAIVEAHGGRIWVESPPSGGACFAFSLPREAPDVAIAGPQPTRRDDLN